MEMELEEIRGTFKPELIPPECGGEIDDYEEALHVLMKFVGSMASALEQVSGRGANAIVYQAGKRMGHDAGKLMEKTDNLENAMEELSQILGKEFYFEMWKPSSQESFTIERSGETEVKLLFRGLCGKTNSEKNRITSKRTIMLSFIWLHGRCSGRSDGHKRKTGY